MTDLKIEGSKGTFFIPSVSLEAETGKCEISGESYLEDTMKFYGPLIKWFEAYAETKPSGQIELKMKLHYFNTSSSRALSLMLQTLKTFEQNGGDVTVVWYHRPDDDDMVEEIEDFIEETGLDVILFPEAGDY